MGLFPLAGQFIVRNNPYSGIANVQEIKRVYYPGQIYGHRLKQKAIEVVCELDHHEYVHIRNIQIICDTELEANIWLVERDLKLAKEAVARLTDALETLKGK